MTTQRIRYRSPGVSAGLKKPAHKTDKTKPVSLRLTLAEFEQLQARAYPLSASPTGIARDLIRTGLAGGDHKALADRMMTIERRFAVIDQQNRDLAVKAEAIDQNLRSLLAMFEALLKALTGEVAGGQA
jgi:hypothetical protein